MALIIRACTFSAAITTPEPATGYSKIVVTFVQDQEIIVQKDELNGLIVSEDGVLVELSQEETAQFRPSLRSPMGARQGSKVAIQIRAYKRANDAPGSKIWEIDVQDSLDEGVLPGV